jgi:ethanolamine utilization protein EutN
MFLARVLGSVVATTKHGALEGRKLLLVQPQTPEGKPSGKSVIAVDAVDAGVGDHVLVADEGNAAGQILRIPRGPIRTVIVGVVDAVESGSGAP